MKCMISSLHETKNSNLRFTLTQSLQKKQNIFLGKKFKSKDLYKCDELIEQSGKILIAIRIEDLTETLKRITLKGTIHGHRKSVVFFKSDLIKEKEYE